MGFLDRFRQRDEPVRRKIYLADGRVEEFGKEGVVRRIIGDKRVQVVGAAAALLAGVVAIGSRFLPQEEGSPELFSRPGELQKIEDVPPGPFGGLFSETEGSSGETGLRPKNFKWIEYPVTEATPTHEGTLEDGMGRIVNTLQKYVYPEVMEELENLFEEYKKDRGREKLDKFIDRVKEILQELENQLKQDEMQRLHEMLRRLA